MIDWNHDGEIDPIDIAVTCAMLDETENKQPEDRDSKPGANPNSGASGTGSRNSGCAIILGIIIFGYLLLELFSN